MRFSISRLLQIFPIILCLLTILIYLKCYSVTFIHAGVDVLLIVAGNSMLFWFWFHSPCNIISLIWQRMRPVTGSSRVAEEWTHTIYRNILEYASSQAWITMALLYSTRPLLMGPSHVKTSLMPYENNKGADQPAHPCSLISTFVVHCLGSMIWILVISKVSRF